MTGSLIRRRRFRDEEALNPWVTYTDMLSSTLIILLLAVGIASTIKSLNEKPPLITLSSTESFRFPTGSYWLSKQFREALDAQYRDKIVKYIKDYQVDVIEVIGHTDGQPNPGTSNLDSQFIGHSSSRSLKNFETGSNADLGLMRAVAVGQYLEKRLKQDNLRIQIRPYSAAGLIDTNGHFQPAKIGSDASRRRIELRFTRSS